jgi:hypothetical protein
MMGLPNGERTGNTSRRVPIEWASCDMRSWPYHRKTQSSPQAYASRWTAIGSRPLAASSPFGHLAHRP